MKKLLFIIPLCLALTVSAQTPKDSKAIKPSKEKDSKSLTTLDGKSYKITLQSRKAEDVKNSSGTSGSSTRTPQTQTGVGTAPQNSDYNTANTPNSAGAGSGNTDVVTGERNTNKVSGSGTGSTSGTTYQSGSQTGNTAVNNQNPAGVGGMNNSNPSSVNSPNSAVNQTTGSGAVTGTSRDLPPNVANDNANTVAPVDNTSSATPGTATNSTATEARNSGSTTTGAAPTAKPSLNGSATDESLVNKKMILTFDNGMISSSTLASKGVDNCPYHVNSSDGNILSFSSNCKSSGTQVRGMWSGIVDGNSIRGNFTWTTEDGQNISYTFTGSTASQKDIDATRELGVR